MDNWMSMETAPKDGRGVLIIDMTAQLPEACSAYFYDEKWWMLAEDERSRDEDDWALGCPWMTTPTHWQPLPTPPKAQP